jgi:predicted MFS family arabinose efflux permease
MGSISEPVPPAVRTWSPWRALVAVLCGQTMASLDGSIVTVAAPNIQVDLHASGAALQLLVASYLITFGVLVVTGARLGARQGHRRVFLTGLSVFVTASLACGLALGPWSLVAFRVVQGAGGALMVPQVVATIHLHFDGALRARAIGAYSLVLSLGVLLGQVIGGLLVSADLLGLGWRPIFLVNVPTGLVVFLLAYRDLPRAAGSAAGRLDLGGIALLGPALATLLVPLAVGREADWPAWTWPCLAAGTTGVGAFAAYERRLARRGGEPLLDLDMLAERAVRAGGTAICGVMGAYAALIFTLTLHLQEGLGYSALRSGLTFAWYASGFAVASVASTRLEQSAGRLLPLVGYAGFGAGMLALIPAAHGPWPAWALPVLTLTGACHSLAFSPLFHHVTTRVATRHAAELSGLLTTATLLASAASIAALGSVYFAAGSSDVGFTRVLIVDGAAMIPAALAAARALGMTSAARPLAPIDADGGAPCGHGHVHDR